MELFINDISKSFKDFKAVDKVNVKLTPGIWGLLGPNGAGKTTLMRMLVGNLKQTDGEILLGGENISKLKGNYLDYIGYLPQEFGYDSNQSVLDFLNYMGALKGLDKKTRFQRINSLLDEFNLDSVKHKKVAHLSGGMKRRVGICQAMLNDPKILIVDEPTAGLDIEERRRFREYLAKISKDKIIIVSTHIVSDIEFIANYLIIMEKGQVVTKGHCQPLIESLEGKVFETVVSHENMEEIKRNYLVINFRSEGSSKAAIRYIADSPLSGSKAVSPCLNDLYLSKVSEV